MEPLKVSTILAVALLPKTLGDPPVFTVTWLYVGRQPIDSRQLAEDMATWVCAN